ncbi:MAG: hypothetical protein MUP90_12390, partial [Gammaproteobacteria bacterium]|nr:hypothetical protein [Gammaproteobacteria bacterium]
SVMGYAGTTKRMPDIGRELGVATLLEGGVQRSGNRVRINVQLIEAASDEHLWAEVYDRELTADNLFDIQTNITRAIASALQAVLTGQEQLVLEQKPTENLEAYAYYLRGKAAAVTYGRNSAQIDASIATYQKAIDLDPGFAAAYAALSTDLIEYFWINGRVGGLGPARQALDKARQLAPESADTLIAEGYFLYWGNLDYAGAIHAFDRALAAKPGSLLAMRGRAYTLRRMGRLEDSLASFKRNMSLDPLNGATAVEIATTLGSMGYYDEAYSRLAEAKALGEVDGFVRYVEATLLMTESRLDEAQAAIGTLSESTTGFQVDLLFRIARYAHKPKLIERVMEFSALHASDGEAFEASALRRAQLLWDAGQKAELAALLDQLEPKLLKVLKTSPDQGSPLLGLMSIYAMRGDRAQLDDMVYRYDNELKLDALRAEELGFGIPTAYAMIGDAEAAMHRIDMIIQESGIWSFYSCALEPAFYPMRDHPHYKTLAEAYRRWLENPKP